MAKYVRFTISKLIVTFLLCCPTVLIAQTAAFTADITSGCSPLTVKFKDQSTGSSTKWTWDFGNGNTAPNIDNRDVEAIYKTPGDYVVKLTLSNGSSATKTIKVFGNPTANFVSTPSTGCSGETIAFSSTSALGSTSLKEYTWKFGEGPSLISASSTATHSYAPGTYTVALIITDNNDCTHDTSKTLVIVPGPTASFTTIPSSPAKCVPPLSVKFNNTSTINGSVSYSWDFGDGSPLSTDASPDHTYSSLGSFTPRLVVTQGACGSTTQLNAHVKIQDITVDFNSKLSACVNENIVFTSTVVPAATSYLWNFGDSTSSTIANPTHSYTKAGDYEVTLQATDASGCTNKKTKTIKINTLPVANFGATFPSCLPFKVNFTDSSTNAAGYLWDFGDTLTSTNSTPVHTYKYSGTHSVSLRVISAEGCTASFKRVNFVNITPIKAAYTTNVNKGCVPLTVNHTSVSTANSPIVSYDWYFGDGSTPGTGANPTHQYTTTGTFSDTLVITTSLGCKDTTIRFIRTGNKPDAKFTVIEDTVCYKQPVDFIDQTTGPVNNWSWSFGDGGTRDSVQNPIYIYGDTGTFDVRLIALYNGCPDTLILDSIVTILPPKAQFKYTLSCVNKYTVAFEDLSAKADSIVWNMGDGNIDASNTKKNFSHTYTTRGSKTVRLTAFNYNTGCADSIDQTFVIADPIARFKADTTVGCYTLPIIYTNLSQDANAYKWYFGDGDTSILASPPVHTYLTTKMYFPQLIITDVNGCTDTKIDTINVVGPLPNFTADKTKGCAPLPVLFSDASLSDSTKTQWIWDFGDGTKKDTTSLPTISHNYIKAGSYVISMTLSDKNGCVKSKSISNYIVPTFPIPSFAADNFSCKGKVLTFNATATNAVSPKYFWNFGDNASEDSTTTTSIQHTYSADNLYTVRLRVRDVNGCIDSIKKQIRILQPVASFTDSVVNYKCGKKTVYFKSTSTGYVNSWSWNFGDGGTSGDSVFTNPYIDPGTFAVTLIVKNPGGCVDTLRKDSIVVVPGPIGDFSFTPPTGCNPLKVLFTAASNNTDTYSWDFGDGNVVTTPAKTISHIYSKQITVTPILLLGNTLPNGLPCQLAAVNNTGAVKVNNVVGVNITPGIVNAEEGEIYFLNPVVTNLKGKPSYFWEPSIGLNCFTCEKPGVKPTKTTTYYLTVTDTNGCIGKDSVVVLFNPCIDADPILIPNVFTPNGDGKNDAFTIEGDCYKKDYSLTIYNRWGELLFSSADNTESWDGRSSAGSFVAEGVYYYILRRDGKISKGHISLIKD